MRSSPTSPTHCCSYVAPGICALSTMRAQARQGGHQPRRRHRRSTHLHLLHVGDLPTAMFRRASRAGGFEAPLHYYGLAPRPKTAIPESEPQSHYSRDSACTSSRNLTGAIELRRMPHVQIGRIGRTVLLSATRIGLQHKTIGHLGVAEDKRRPTRPVIVKALHILLNEIIADALGERQVAGKIHCRGLATHIAFPSVRTGLPPPPISAPEDTAPVAVIRPSSAKRISVPLDAPLQHTQYGFSTVLMGGCSGKPSSFRCSAQSSGRFASSSDLRVISLG